MGSNHSLYTNPEKHKASRTIAIVGGGLSGTSVAIQLLLGAATDLHIVLIESRRSLGRGIAYSTEFDSHLLNVPAGNMSVLPHSPNHFVDWLNRSTGKVWDANDLVPRRLYGDYISDTLRDAQSQAAAGIKFSWIRARAVDAWRQQGVLRIELNSGPPVEADLAVLALGNAASSAAESNRIPMIQPWNWRELLEVPIAAPVLIIGTALTAVDVVLSLDDRGHQGPIFMVSRRGLLPTAHSEAGASAPAAPLTEFPTSTRGLLRLVRQSADRMIRAGGDWRTTVDELRPHTARIWQSLTLEERRRFLRHVRPYWEVHRHRMAPAIAARIGKLLDAGRLRIYAGRILSMSSGGTRRLAQIRCRTGELVTLEFEYAINCAGVQEDPLCWDNPLVKSLLRRGMIQPDALNIGLLADRHGGLLGVEGCHKPDLFTLGPTLKGQLWETTAVPEIREQARTLAQVLLATLGAA